MANGNNGEPSKKQAVWWCRIIVNRPKLMFGLTLGGHLLLCVITAVLIGTGYNILPIVFDDLPLQIDDDVYFLRNEAYDNRYDNLDSEEEIPPIPVKVEEDAEKTDTKKRRRRSFQTLPSDLTEPLSFLINLNKLHRQYDDGMQYEGADMLLWNNSHPPCFQVIGQDTCDSRKQSGPTSSFLFPAEKPLLRLRRAEGDETNQTEEEETDVWERRYGLTTLQLMYEDKLGGNVFTKENLQAIASFEYDLYNDVKFQRKYCRLSKIFKTYQCRPFNSVLRLFDGTIDNDLFDPSFTNISGIILRAFNDNDLHDLTRYFLGKDAILNNSEVSSSMTRSTMYYGRPYLENLDRWEDSRADDMTAWRLYAYDELIPMLKSKFENGVGKLDFYFNSGGIYFAEVRNQVFVDWYFLIGSILFIFCFMWFQTESLWITGWGLLSVVTSFVGANLIYNIVLDYKFFGIFNVLAIFIVLGVGADDIFVFIDTWRLLEEKHFDRLEDRLSECYRRAASTMFVTSLTTMAAFFVSAVSPILSVSAFGVFAAITIFVNYMSVIIFFPTVVITYHLYFSKNNCLCCRVPCCNSPPSPSLPSSLISANPATDSELTRNKSTEKLTAVDVDESRKRRMGVKVDFVVRFFEGPFFSLVSHRIGKWVILAVTGCLLGGAIYSCTNLETETSTALKLFRSHNVYEIGRYKYLNDFMETEDDRKAEIRFVWGLGLQDRSECHRRRWDSLSKCYGETVWDKTFDINRPDSQIALLKFCKKLKHMKGKEELKIELEATTGENKVDCFIEGMDAFFREKVSKSERYPNLSIGIPITRSSLSELLKLSPDIYSYKQDAMEHVTRPFEIAYQFWVNEGYGHFNFSEEEEDRMRDYSSLVGQRKISRTNLAWDRETTNTDEIYQTKIKFVAVKVYTTEYLKYLGIQTGIPFMDAWEKFAVAEIKQLPEGLNNGWQIGEYWAWLRMIETLVRQGILGIAIGLALSFIVIFLGTQNIIIAILATIVLSCVSAFVIAIIPLAGWKIGLLEALNLCLVVGLSVDYIVHLAEAYYLSSAVYRLDRTKEALQKVGISILSGALTTLGASFFMLFAEILFFMQFGIFIFCTIGFSMLSSLFFFSALFCIIGPEGNTGSILPYLVRLKDFVCQCCKKTSTDEGPDMFSNPNYVISEETENTNL